MKVTIIISFIISSNIILPCFSATDTLTTSDYLNTTQTLISAGGLFELGFFNKGQPKKYYLGIWYKDIPSQDAIVWVANRDSPTYKDTTVLKLGNSSNFVILDDVSHVIWQTNSSNAVDPVLQLLDSGNLVLRETDDINGDNYIWQSFDHPTDTLIPGQKLGWNFKMGQDLFLSSWRGADDPGTGNFTITMDYHGDPEIYLRKRDQIIYRSGPWVGQHFNGMSRMTWPDILGFNFTFYIGPDQVYYSFELPQGPQYIMVKSRLTLSYEGVVERWAWVPTSNQWDILAYSRKDQCDDYRECGQYGVCNVNAFFVCQCPQGFEPRNPYAWGLRDFSDGCVRKTKLDCESDGFLPMDNMKLPETTTAYVDAGLDLDQCRELCRKNCGCTAYAYSEFVLGAGSGCVIWIDDLTDMRNFAEGGQTLYLRLADSDSGETSSIWKIIIPIVASVVALVVVLFTFYLWRWKGQGHDKQEIGSTLDQLDCKDLPIFKFESMVLATNNFSQTNKLGQGGFGPVYKGELEDGQQIAVKRLSRASGQGLQEFMNEVVVISKLQHKNLVRLLGCCIEGEEKVLVYEYMPNKSLDSLLFDAKQRLLLDWKKRFDIIKGICRGLLYLHRDARLKIIHRDLKASNILLDEELNPKISDFGTARIFGTKQDQANTIRVVGTYGYMSPEYAMEGLFSEKSDVYSFGVLLLEIVSGKTNKSLMELESMSLLTYVWQLWNVNNPLQLIDPTVIVDPCSQEEILKCIHLGLLCVQEFPEDRQSIDELISMLDAKGVTDFPQPKPPGFTQRKVCSTDDCSQDGQESVNLISLTVVSVR